MKTTTLFIVLAFVSVLFFYSMATFVPESEVSGLKLYSEVFETDNGFGYTVAYEGKTLIRQKNIPAIQELKSFCSKDDALKVADLVIKKLEGNKPPTISQEELIKLKIWTNCLKQPK